MPAILRREDVDAWLNGSADDARAALRQYDPGLMDAYEVSARVNKPDNNEPSLRQPVRQQAADKAEPTQQEDLFYNIDKYRMDITCCSLRHVPCYRLIHVVDDCSQGRRSITER